MKIPLLLLSLFLLASFSILPDEWSKATLPNNITVELPSLPPLEKAEGIEGYRVHNGRTAFIASAAQLTVPSNQKITPYDARVILMGAEKGAVESAGAELIAKADFKIGTTAGRELTFKTTDTPSGEPLIHHMRLFIFDRRMFSFQCWYPENRANESLQDKEKFFHSINIQQ